VDFSKGRPLSAFSADWKPSWNIAGLWQAHGLNLLFGAPRSRKSTLRGYLTVCALARLAAFGRFPIELPPKRAALFLGEEIAEAEAARLLGIAAALGVPRAAIEQRITLFSPDSGLRLDQPASVESLLAFLRAQECDFVSIDPLVNFHSAPENDATAMAAVMARCVRLTAAATVVVVHHTAKPMANGPARSVSHQARGSSAIGGYTATNLLLERDGTSEFHRLHVESKYSRAEQAPLWLRADERGVWTNTEPRPQLRENVASFLAANPTASANAVADALKLRRQEALKLVKELKPREPPEPV
jgi:RecA-family ATPase